MAYEQLNEEEEEEYIDMDISPSSYQCNKVVSSPPKSREFEFQMSFNNTTHKEPLSLASPADELFYKGNLLPLHLPPRLQMVQKLLLENASQTASSTPFHSCNISPATSCYVSGELNPDEYLHDFSPATSFTHAHQKKSWSKRFKSIRQASLSSKLKASRAYIKSFFTKAKVSSNGFMNEGKKSPCPVDHGEEDCTPRRSFSLSIRRSPKNKCSSISSSCSTSSSSSSSSSFLSVHCYGSQAGQVLRRSSSAHSEVESSIQGAIAHCKMSQQLVVSGRKSVIDSGFGSLSTSRVAAEKPGLCRG
ncbi:hypothetical protein J5N97_013922 [Dioscorea zingiberensis]|uniref:Membrane-associated kinase regulator 4 n=1 Tax=Dioscorea zingiberensis TaxID=325984 RepID=A0A9D5CS56_9LILI|nr:hypothetical protein J5N97_013922 [Dioscorea zingiberensis]